MTPPRRRRSSQSSRPSGHSPRSAVRTSSTPAARGENLGELTAAGLPVPAGFVVGAPAYGAFCTETGLRQRLAELLDNVDVEDTAALQQASAAAASCSSPHRCPP